jgi:hypothetical protein
MLSVSDIAKELNSGKATIKFLLKRFQKWLPSELADGHFQYPGTCIKTVIFIIENLDAGVLPADIEKKLGALSDSDPSSSSLDNIFDTFAKPSQNEDIRLSNDGLVLLKSLFSDIGEQQKRIAIAHEKRAEAEERKAVAIEKRAGAEEKKAEAMNNIASALQEMNKLRVSDPETMQIAHDTATVIVNDEKDLQDSSEKNINESQVEHQDIQPDISVEIQSETQSEIQIDDLSLLINEEQEIETIDEVSTETDDLSLLLDENSETTDVQPLDDLSQLIDVPSDMEQPVQELDNLAELIEDKPSDNGDSEQLDDLSLLIGSSDPVDVPAEVPAEVPVESHAEDDQNKDEQVTLDDLSKLIDEPSNQTQPAQDMDDLSQLIDEPSDTDNHDQELDNLASPIDSDSPDSNSPEIDDLSKPIDDDTPEIKLDITPEEDLGKYKAAVMKIIIGLKTDGLDVEEATNRLNQNSIKTLSGKPDWSQKAITQIYKFIESA